LNDAEVEEQELNELHWWSHWAKVVRLGEASYVILSGAFREPLFNHATILAHGRRSAEGVKAAIGLFREARTMPSFFVVDNPRYSVTRSSLEAAGFIVSDTMEVMVGRAVQLGKGRSIKMVEAKTDLRHWIDAYVRSFYDGDAPLAHVEAAVRKAAKDKDVSLLLAIREGEVAGEMALFRRGRLLGAYCVGTVPSHRRFGVATQMLSYAMNSASEQGLELVLQTFASDGAFDFYTRRGFKRAYRKYVLVPEAWK
jgi:GNAT superfamily N-acetyltransferase